MSGCDVRCLITLWLSLTSTIAVAEPAEEPSVTVRVYDYTHLRPDLLTRAERHVNEVYTAVGVRTKWIASASLADGIGQASDPSELLLIILNQRMSRRKAVSDDTLGTAVVTPDQCGRIAYVLFDRVTRVARDSARNAMDVMGLVIAHELGHLLMPQESHTAAGLMRARWSVGDFKYPTPEDWSFTPVERERIRAAVADRDRR